MSESRTIKRDPSEPNTARRSFTMTDDGEMIIDQIGGADTSMEQIPKFDSSPDPYKEILRKKYSSSNIVGESRAGEELIVDPNTTTAPLKDPDAPRVRFAKEDSRMSKRQSSHFLVESHQKSAVVKNFKKLQHQALSRTVYVSKKDPGELEKMETMVFQFYRDNGMSIDLFRKLVMNIKTRMKFEGTFEDTKKEVELAIFKKVSPLEVQQKIDAKRREIGFGEESYLKLAWYLKKIYGHGDILRAMGMLQYLKYHEVNIDSLNNFITQWKKENKSASENSRQKMLKAVTSEFGVSTEKAIELLKEHRTIRKPKQDQINKYVKQLREELGTGEEAYDEILKRMKSKFDLKSLDKSMTLLKRAQGGVTDIEGVRELILASEAEGLDRKQAIQKIIKKYEIGGMEAESLYISAHAGLPSFDDLQKYIKEARQKFGNSEAGYTDMIAELKTKFHLSNTEQAMNLMQEVNNVDTKRMQEFFDKAKKKYGDGDYGAILQDFQTQFQGYDMTQAMSMMENSGMDPEMAGNIANGARNLFSKYSGMITEFQSKVHATSIGETINVLKGMAVALHEGDDFQETQKIVQEALDKHADDVDRRWTVIATDINDLLPEGSPRVSSQDALALSYLSDIDASDFEDAKSFLYTKASEMGLEPEKLIETVCELPMMKAGLGMLAKFDLGGTMGSVANFASETLRGAQAKMATFTGPPKKEGGFPSVNSGAIKDFLKETALNKMWEQFDTDGSGTVDRDELAGLVGTVVKKFLGTVGLKDLDDALVNPYIQKTITALFANTQSGEFLTFEEFSNFGVLMKSMNAMMAEIDVAALATRAMMDGLWRANKDKMEGNSLPIDRCEGLIKDMLSKSMDFDALKDAGMSSSQFAEHIHGMISSVTSIIDLDGDGSIDYEEFLQIGTLVSKFTAAASGGMSLDIKMLEDFINADILERYWNRYNSDGDDELSIKELEKLLNDVVSKFASAISIWTGNKIPDVVVHHLVKELAKQVTELLDDDGDGTISKSEFLNFTSILRKIQNVSFDPRNLGEFMTKKMMDELWEQYDDDDSGELTHDEMARLIRSLVEKFTRAGAHFDDDFKIPESQIKPYVQELTEQVMEHCDKDGDGTISKVEFEHFAEWLKDFKGDASIHLQKVKKLVSDTLVNKLWDKYDDDNSGSLEEPEIKAMLHDILLKMPILKGAFGNNEITTKDTEPFVNDMLQSLMDDFDDDNSRSISKTEISDISAAITSLKKSLDLKNLRDVIENRAIDKLWAKYAGDDGLLNKDEMYMMFSDMVNMFNDSQTDPLPPEATDPFVHKMVDAVFREYDDDKSGEISRDEFTDAPRFLAKLRDEIAKLDFTGFISEEMLMELWDEFDIDGDGTLDKDELQDMIRVLLIKYNDSGGTIDDDEMDLYVEELVKAILEQHKGDKKDEDLFITRDEFRDFHSWIHKLQAIGRMVTDDISGVLYQFMSGEMMTDIWQEFDLDGSGTIDHEELHDLTKALVRRFFKKIRTGEIEYNGELEEMDEERMKQFVDELHELFIKNVDADGDGEVTEQEFQMLGKTMAALSSAQILKLKSEQIGDYIKNNADNIKKIWNEFDRDHNGILDDEELTDFCIRLTQEIVVAQTKQVPTVERARKRAQKLKETFLKNVDADGDGLVSWEEFHMFSDVLLLTALQNNKDEDFLNEDADAILEVADDFMDALAMSPGAYTVRFEKFDRAESVFIDNATKGLDDTLTAGVGITSVYRSMKMKEQMKKMTKTTLAKNMLSKLPNADRYGNIIGADGAMPNSHAIFNDLGALLADKMGDEYEGMDPFTALDHLDEAAAAAMEGDIKNIMMKNFMTAAADQTNMSPAMKKQLALIMEDPEKLQAASAKLAEKMGGDKSGGEVAMDELFAFANGEMDDFQAQMLEGVFADVVAQHIDEYRDRIVDNVRDFLYDTINNNNAEEGEKGGGICSIPMAVARFFGWRIGSLIGFVLCVVGAALSFIVCILFTILTMLTCLKVDSIISIFMISALGVGVLVSTSRACIICLADPESAIVGLAISLIQQLITSSFVHDFLRFLDRNVAWFHLLEFLHTATGMVFDVVADQIKAMKLADLIKMMVQEEADELQLQEEMEIEAKLAEEMAENNEEDSDSVMSPAEIREQLAMERRRSKAHHRATLSQSHRKSFFEQRGTTLRHNSIQDQKKLEFLRKRKSSTAVTPH